MNAINCFIRELKYLHIEKHENCFCIFSSNTKPVGKVSTTLGKIYSVILNEFPIINKENNTKYEFDSSVKKWEDFQELASVIKNRFLLKHQNRLIKPLDHGKVIETFQRIVTLVNIKVENELTPPPVLLFEKNPTLVLPEDVVYKIATFLSTQRLAIFGRLNRTAHSLTKNLIKKRKEEIIQTAHKLNYRGNSVKNAVKYLNSIDKGMPYVKNYLFSDFVAKNDEKIDFNATLKNFKKLNLTKDSYIQAKALTWAEQHNFKEAIYLICGWGDRADGEIAESLFKVQIYIHLQTRKVEHRNFKNT